MPHEDEVTEEMEILHMARARHLGDILSDVVGWSPGQSATVQAGRALENLVALGRLKKENGWYMIPTCKAKPGEEHAALLAEQLVQLRKKFRARIFREHLIEEVGLRPDALVLAIGKDRGFCFVLEIVNHETEEYLQSKINVWKNWQGANEYLSRLFAFKVPHFEVITLRKGEQICEKLPPL
jgi:hypothetical protein